MKRTSKQQAILAAVRDNSNQWPAQLSSGIMFYDGQRITIDEFIKYANAVGV